MKDVKENILTLSYELEGTLNELIERLSKYQQSYKDDYHDLEIERQLDYDGDVEYILVGRRPETEKERKSRLKREKDEQERIEERERKLFEKLRNKYEQ